MQQLQEESLRNRIALGWVINLVLVVIMLVLMTIDSILMDDNFRSLRIDPGRRGLGLLVYIFAFYALMPVYIHLVHGIRTSVSRWVAVGLAALGFIYFLLHHLSHWRLGQRPDFTSHVVDLVFHVVSLWVIVNSVNWARFPRMGTL